MKSPLRKSKESNYQFTNGAGATLTTHVVHFSSLAFFVYGKPRLFRATAVMGVLVQCRIQLPLTWVLSDDPELQYFRRCHVTFCLLFVCVCVCVILFEHISISHFKSNHRQCSKIQLDIVTYIQQ